VAVLGVASFINEQLRGLDVNSGIVAAALAVVIGAHIRCHEDETARRAIAKSVWSIIREAAGLESAPVASANGPGGADVPAKGQDAPRAAASTPGTSGR
jgi:hypothetical protein